MKLFELSYKKWFIYFPYKKEADFYYVLRYNTNSDKLSINKEFVSKDIKEMKSLSYKYQREFIRQIWEVKSL